MIFIGERCLRRAAGFLVVFVDRDWPRAEPGGFATRAKQLGDEFETLVGRIWQAGA